MRIVLLTIAVLFGVLSHSQLLENGRPGIMPPSPSAFQFLKYGEIPISKYTGVPNISVPIYTIKARGLDLPINLTYHSNGVKVDEEASWIGLGWTLNTGGNIVQIVNGFDDFGPYKNRTFPNIDEIANVASNGSAPSGILSSCTGTYISIENNKFNMPNNSTRCSWSVDLSSAIPLELWGEGNKDFEPDVFKFNALGYSGTFVLDWESETFKCLTDSKIKIEVDTNSPNANSKITIILPEGHHLVFSVKEETDIYSTSSVIKTSSRVYKLDDIYTSLNDHIKFDYTITNPIKNYVSNSSINISYEAVSGSGSYALGGLLPSAEGSIAVSQQAHSYVNKITFNKGVLLFTMSNRLDILGAKKLDNIKLKSSATSTKAIKSFDFNYNYFISNTNGGYDNKNYDYIEPNLTKPVQERTYRLKLNSVGETGKPPYIFTYNSTLLPQKTSYARDYWGYYNGKLTNNSLFPNLARFNYVNAPSNSNNRSSSENHCKASILEKIEYPTGGYTIFNYELNSFTNYIVPNLNNTISTVYNSNHISKGGGLRIEKIENFNHDNQKISQKLFTYTGGKIMTPLNFYNKAYISTFNYSIQHPGSYSETKTVRGYRVKESTSSFIVPSINASGNFVGYDKVTEHFVSKNSETENVGRIEYVYENHIDEGIFTLGQGSDPVANNDWNANGVYTELNLPTREKNATRNGSLLEQRIYNKNNILKQKIINKYAHTIKTYCSNGLRIGALYFKGMCGQHPYYNINYMLGVYPIRGLYSYLTNSNVTNYFNGNEVVTNIEYLYNDNLQVKEKRTSTSKGTNIFEYFTYPTGSYSNYLSNLTSYKKIFNSKIIEDIHYSYSSINKYGMHHTIHPLAHERNIVKDVFISYKNDKNGNPVKKTQEFNGLATYYIWDYSGKYLMAKIDAGLYNKYNQPLTIPTYLINNIVNASQDLDSQNLKNAQNALRNNFPSLLITTYTYNNLVGIKSITGPDKQTLYYHYDDFNRLEVITDKDNKVIRKNEYNYKN